MMNTFEAKGGVHWIQRNSTFCSDRMKSTQVVQLVPYEENISSISAPKPSEEFSLKLAQS